MQVSVNDRIDKASYHYIRLFGMYTSRLFNRRHEQEYPISILTPASEEYLDGDALQQIASGEDGAHLAEVPLPVQMLAVFQHLKHKNNTNIDIIITSKTNNFSIY